VRILLVAGRQPWPPRRGDQLRTTQMVTALSAEHEVTLLAPPAAAEPPSPATRREVYHPRARAWLAAPALLLRGWPAQVVPFAQPDLARQLRRLAPHHDLVVIQLVRLATHLRDLGSTPVVADLIDCLSLNVRTRAAVAPAWQRAALAAEGRRVARAERRLLAAARRALVVCERDRAALAAVAPEAADRLAVVPVAVEPGPPPAARPGPPTVMLTGNLGYFANRDAVEHWLRELWPPVRRAGAGLRLVVAGDRPSPRIRRAVARAGGELVGRPADLRALLAGATVAVAPVRCGSGVPLKVLDAWSVGVPVVASPFAAEGAAATDERELLVADGPEAWATQVRRLLAEPALRARLAGAGRARLEALSAARVYPELLRAIAGDG
jgi:glycosyltransferase involved in cell wall biosynthesis